MKNKKKIPTEIYSRVVGYFRPVNQYNKGKQEEFKERVEYLPKDVFNSMEARFEADKKDEKETTWKS